MPSSDISNKSGAGEKEEVFRNLSQLEVQRKEAGEIVQRPGSDLGREEVSAYYTRFSLLFRFSEAF